MIRYLATLSIALTFVIFKVPVLGLGYCSVKMGTRLVSEIILQPTGGYPMVI